MKCRQSLIRLSHVQGGLKTPTTSSTAEVSIPITSHLFIYRTEGEEHSCSSNDSDAVMIQSMPI